MRRFPINIFTRHVAMDLGTANTQIYVSGKGIVLDEPSVVTLEKKSGKVVGAGIEARGFAGRHGKEFATLRPIRGGVVGDFDTASSMARLFLERALSTTHLMYPRVVLAVPTIMTTAERQVLIEAAERAGAGKVYLIQRAVAAALGAGLGVNQPPAHMIVDIGGGTTEIALVCKYRVACGETVRVAGDDINMAIRDHVRREHHVDLSEEMAEAVKLRIGSVEPLGRPVSINVRSRDVSTGVPSTVVLTDEDIRHAIRRPTLAIVAAVKRVLEELTPDLASDISEGGVWLTGGGALLRGWSRLFYNEAGLEVHIPQDPLRSTIMGIGTIVERFKALSCILSNGRPARFIGW